MLALIFPFFNLELLLWIAPALLLGLFAQWWIHAAYARARRVPARTSGAGAARHILDSAGLYNVAIQEVPGHLSDHYDPRAKVVRLSSEVFHGRSLAAVGIAAHEVGHALQDARGYWPLVIRNAAVPAANLGSSAGLILLILGMLLNFGPLMLVGIGLFACVVVFQLVNLPVEFNASSRARGLVQQLGLVDAYDMGPIRSVLNAAALTYVAATLQSVLTLLYYLSFFTGGRRSE